MGGGARNLMNHNRDSSFQASDEIMNIGSSFFAPYTPSTGTFSYERLLISPTSLYTKEFPDGSPNIGPYS
ncbi:hypothetical protein E2C01_004150 [Portunus trituberculatus]|uniref:Uncharacterized protein n=1 Tax=Portunus trituberculatus TaxID=210409 RepID=A0A5B7CVJ9_PORTR|nr:hypothetical protein [Portunus trituberculatus]